MRRPTTRQLPLFPILVAVLAVASCEDDTSPVGNEPTDLGLQETTVSQREPGDVPTLPGLQAPSRSPDPNSFQLVLRDNENYYYMLNRSGQTSRLWSGEVYYLYGSTFLFRGPAKMVNRGNSALALHYLDPRFNKMGLLTVDFGTSSGGGAFYFEPTNGSWNLTVYLHSGSF